MVDGPRRTTGTTAALREREMQPVPRRPQPPRYGTLVLHGRMRQPDEGPQPRSKATYRRDGPPGQPELNPAPGAKRRWHVRLGSDAAACGYAQRLMAFHPLAG